MTRRRRWLLTLWRCSTFCTRDTGWMWRRALLVLLVGAPWQGQAATLRGFIELAGPVVKLSDLFAGLDAAPDRVLGPAPAPGGRILVEAPQLAAIARDYGVAWRPESGNERAVLERAGAPMALPPIMAALRAALLAAGAALDADIDMPGFDPPVVPAGSDAIPAVAQLSFDTVTGRFTALLAVSAPDMPPIHARLSGQVTVMVQAAILTRHVRPGIVLTAEDVRTARIRAGLLRGNAALAADAVIGQALRHDMQAGQALSASDITRPRLVARNDVVRMTLQAGGIALAAQGIALEDGGEGDRITVQNPSSHAVMIAEITGADEVRVTPDRAPLIVAAQ